MSSRGDNKERGFFRSIVSSIGSSSGTLRSTQSTTASSSGGSPNQEHASMSKHNSFSGTMSFNRSPEDNLNGTVVGETNDGEIMKGRSD